jgi:hypothetical protein
MTHKWHRQPEAYARMSINVNVVVQSSIAKAREKSRLEILVWRVQKGEPNLARASVVTQAPAKVNEPPARTEPKPRQPPDLTWKPAPAESGH